MPTRHFPPAASSNRSGNQRDCPLDTLPFSHGRAAGGMAARGVPPRGRSRPAGRVLGDPRREFAGAVRGDSVHIELTREQVRRDRIVVVRIRRRDAMPFARAGYQSLLAHEPRDPLRAGRRPSACRSRSTLALRRSGRSRGGRCSDHPSGGERSPGWAFELVRDELETIWRASLNVWSQAFGHLKTQGSLGRFGREGLSLGRWHRDPRSFAGV